MAGTALGVYGWLTIGVRSLFSHGCSFSPYASAMWAFTQAPIALVTAVRETSIVFALLIGVLFLKEKLDVAKVFATFLTVTGAVFLRFGRV